MDFVRYAEAAAALLNAPLETRSDVEDLLAEREWLRPRLTDRDPAALRRLQRELRPVFESSARGDEAGVVAALNELLAKHPLRPSIAGHGEESWHLHVADRSSSVAELLSGEALMGLAFLVCEVGATRLGVCQAPRCDHVFVDTSHNQSRRYCCDRCSSRANVAAYRARLKTALP
jgi:predicted RNA-binding Zn ribbon-like protein